MPRRKKADASPPMVRWSIHIPMTLAGIVENYFFDKLHQKPEYGRRQELIVGLLQSWAIREGIMEVSPNSPPPPSTPQSTAPGA